MRGDKNRARRTFVLRGFYAEGFVNQYTGNLSEDGKILMLESESIENAQPGTKARLEFLLKGPRELEQNFYVAWPGRDFSCYINMGLRCLCIRHLEISESKNLIETGSIS